MSLKKEAAKASRKPTKKTAPTPAIIMEASDGNLAAVKAELEKGADVNATDRGGGTALHQAVVNHHLEVVKLLLSAGADVNVGRGYRPLHFAARERQLSDKSTSAFSSAR